MFFRPCITISHRYYLHVIQWSNRRFLCQHKSQSSIIPTKRFIWKLITGSALVVGVPYIIYHNSSRFQNDSPKLAQIILPKEPILDKSVKLIENLPDKVLVIIKRKSK